MSTSAKRHLPPETEPVRVLGRGLRAQRGVRLTMRVVREAAGKTQVDVAAQSQMDQADVSRLESREDDHVLVAGLPPIDMTIAGGVAGDTATAAIVVNSIPKVVVAAPGVVTMKDLPIVHHYNPAEVKARPAKKRS